MKAAAAQPSRRKLKQKLHAHGLSQVGSRAERGTRVEARGLGGIKGASIGMTLKQLDGARRGGSEFMVLTQFKHGNFRVRYLDGSEFSLKRPVFMRVFAATLLGGQ